MKLILWLLLFAPILLLAQPRYEIQEFTGILKSIESSYGLAYEKVTLDVAGKIERFSFFPYHGKVVMENLKEGNQVSIKVNVNLAARENLAKLVATNPKMAEYFFRDYITEIKGSDGWISLPERKNLSQGSPPLSRLTSNVFLEKKVLDVFKLTTGDSKMIGLTKALIFDNGIAAAFYIDIPAMQNIAKGDVVSFYGYRFSADNGEVYPVPGIKEVYSFFRLIKNRGVIKSLLFKQNTVCIGVTLETEDSEIQVSFPTEFGVRVKDFLISGREVTFYYGEYKQERLLDPRELHALVADSDTLKVDKGGFYGGADGKHEYQPATASGKITRINRSDKGKIMSVIVGGDAFIEITLITAQQIEPFLKKGKEMEVTGDERIKKEGEIYQKEYRLITPKTIKLDGKEFLLK